MKFKFIKNKLKKKKRETFMMRKRLDGKQVKKKNILLIKLYMVKQGICLYAILFYLSESSIRLEVMSGTGEILVNIKMKHY